MALARLQLHLSLLHFLPSDIAPPGSVENVLDCFNTCLKNQECVSLIYDRYKKQCYTYPGRLEVPFWGTDLNTDLDIYNTDREGYGCPSHLGYDFNSTMNVCFKIHGGTETQIQAHKNCNSDGGHLIRITSSAKDEFVSVIWPHQKTLVDGMCYVEGGWKYSNGDNVTYFRWMPNQPNAECGQGWGRCLERSVSGFNDVYCWHPLPFICEFDI